MTEAIVDVTRVFALALALALVIERLLEMLKASYDLLDSRRDLHAFWTARAERTARRLEHRVDVFRFVEPARAAAALRRFDELLLGPGRGETGVVPVLCGDLVRTAWVRATLKLVGIGLGILMALALDLDLLAILQDERTASAPGMLLTGAVLGLGSGPVHKVIAAIERERERRARKEAAHA